MTTLPLAAVIESHIFEAARRQAEQGHREAPNDFWQGADAAWSRVQLGAAERLARSARRLQARLQRRSAGGTRRRIEA